MQTPDVSYARSGDVAIAYQTVGSGSVDVLFARGFAGDLLSVWEQPLLARFLEDLASFARVTAVDKRGTGLSDRVGEVPTLETRMDDLRAVMDAIGSEQAILWTAQEGARLATLFAATYPERTAGLVLFDPTAKGRRTPDYPWALTDEEWRVWLTDVREGWGRTDFLERQLVEWAPSKQEDPQFRSWFIAHMRRGFEPRFSSRLLPDGDGVGRERGASLCPRPHGRAVERSRARAGPVLRRADSGSATRRVAAEPPEHLPLGRRGRLRDRHARDAQARGGRGACCAWRSRARDRPLHRHRRLDRARVAAR